MSSDPDRPAARAPTSDQIRHALDFAQGGDKVPFPDPATAPLGTDDEAAGRPPSRVERMLAAVQEFSRTRSRALAERKPDHEGETWSGPVMIGTILASALVVLSVYVLP